MRRKASVRRHISRVKNVQLDNTDIENLQNAEELIREIATKHSLNYNEVFERIVNLEKEIRIPAILFRSQLGPLEAVVKYLRDNLGLSFVKISTILLRDENTIWTSYNNAILKKYDIKEDFSDLNLKKWKITLQDLSIPISILAKKKLSILESISCYLMDDIGLSYSKIAKVLNRDDRTIWTVINRARKKNER